MSVKLHRKHFKANIFDGISFLADTTGLIKRKKTKNAIIACFKANLPYNIHEHQLEMLCIVKLDLKLNINVR